MTVIVHPSPVGALTLQSDGRKLISIWFDDDRRSRPPVDHSADAVLDQACRELDEYFSGRRMRFEVPAAPVMGTPFQRAVWLALTEISFGATASYGEIAKAIGRPKAVRAVGAANGANPLPIVVPCHRVIGADGSLTGFGGGLPRKTLLLELERRASR